MRYTAKRASLKTIKGCSVPGCGCYTDRGWYVQCREGGSLDTVLFVCEDCFERLYRAKSIIGSFDERAYIRNGDPAYRQGSPWLRRLIRGARQGTRAVRAAEGLAAVFLAGAWFLKENPIFYRIEEVLMIDKIMSNGFIALAAYIYIFALVSLVLFAVAATCNAFLKSGKFDLVEIRKLFFTNLSFMLVFALLDHFLI